MSERKWTAMDLVIAKDYETLSEVTAGIILEKMLKKKRVNLSLTTGNSPKMAYEILVETLSKLQMDTSMIHYYNFDEVALKDKQYGLTMSGLKEALYDPIGVATENIHELTIDNYQDVDKRMAQAGGLDLVLMGLGEDGHFCGNMPGYTDFSKETYSIPVIPGDQMYESLKEHLGEEPGDYFVTFGPKTVMAAKQLVLIVNGEHKAEIIKQVIEGPVTEQIPASILMTHPDITVILDEAAAKLLK